MPIRDPIRRRERHREYMRTVWYPRNRKIHGERIRKNEAARREVIIAEVYKLRLSCIRCGENHPATLDFHHRVPSEKDFPISVAIATGLSLKRILIEIAKCDVLCSNCHRKHHWQEKHS